MDILHPTLHLTHRIRPGHTEYWSGLSGAAGSLAVANTAREHPGLTVVLTENTRQAERLQAEISFFLGSQETLPILEFPDWETLPYDTFSPHQDIVSRRLDTLSRLPEIQRGILVVSVNTLMHRLAPRHYVLTNNLSFRRGQILSLDKLRGTLEQAGYNRVESVYEHGEFAVRGAILDLYPMGAQRPCRIEFFDDEIESLRHFDPETQRSDDTVEQIELLPGREIPLDQAGVTRFRRQFRERFDIDVRHCPLYQDISEGLASPGLEYYLPLFFEEQHSLFDYLPDEVLFFLIGDVHDGAEHFWRDIRSRYEDRRHDLQRPVLPPADMFLAVDETFALLGRQARVSLLNAESAQQAAHTWQPEPFPNFAVDHRAEEPLAPLSHFLAAQDKPVLLCCESAGRRESLIDLLQPAGIRPESLADWHSFLTTRPALGITVGPLETGLQLRECDFTIIAENQLFEHHVGQQRRRQRNEDNTDFIIKSLTELSIGSPVVHLDHGIGRYQGLQSFEIDGQQSEFLILEYADAAKLYVPVSSLHLITRYSGLDPEHAPLHRLGSDVWQKAKRKAQEKIVDVAAELLDVYAKREARPGRQFSKPEDYQLFCNEFPFEETEDQQETINAVLDDLCSPRSMDRLVCGDVGFGKTEVAMRAAFVAVQNNTQVMILVPTTLLAQQHYENFRDRFAGWPVRVELISRFVSGPQTDAILTDLSEGKVDLLIGTHKLLNSNIRYKDLGLLVIDEEHRFGVRQKEKIKSIRANVDILTLTATPIPRTLNLSMSGVRDLSIIATPPARRLSIKTFVRESDDKLVKEAILRELLRGGQVYYLHNEVRTIERTAEAIRDLVPEARVAVGHGQLREKELEHIMSDFYHKKYNILVCSTIIETGIDIPSVNTIIIDRADKFGLAQLHQLRGRVGRSHHQAYAYLLTPPPKSLSADARKRLEAISAADTLGAGFTLASHDLEIRGAGEFLGEEQSGHMQMIGFSLYSEMLEHTVKMMKAGQYPDAGDSLHSSTDINLRVPALIPDDYLPDVHTRLLIYKRIANARQEEDLSALKVEMIDRFGLLPEATRYLFSVTAIKLQAEKLGVDKIEANAVTGKILFRSDTQVDPCAIVTLVQEQPELFRLHGATELRFTHEQADTEQRIRFIEALLARLQPKPTGAR